MTRLGFLWFVQELEFNNVKFLRCFDSESKDYLIPEPFLHKIHRKKDIAQFYISKSLLNFLT